MAAVSAARVPAFKNFLRVMDICFSLNFSADVGSVPGGFWWVPLIYDAVKHIIFLENIQYVIFRSIYGLRGYIHRLRQAALLTSSRLVESTITRRYGVSTTPVRGWVRHSMRGLIDGPTPLTQVVPYHGGGTD